MSDLIGKLIDRYQILEQLGQGGMATVYKALDTRLNRFVAVKIIRKGAFPPDFLDRIIKRFEREAHEMARLNHANIVGVIDYGNYEGTPYMVMPYIPAGTLKNKFQNPIPYQEAAQLLAPIARALAYAHDEGIIHRDVKPSNILITSSNDPMLADFGIAKLLEEWGGHTLTSSGMGLGTVEYMAPEQWLGKAVHNSDQYALGVTFYELITGQKPYVADTPPEVMIKQATEPLPALSQFIPDLPEGVEKSLQRMLSKKPEDRYPDLHIVAKVMDLLAYSSPGKIAEIESINSDHEKDRNVDQLNTETLYEIETNNKEYPDTRIDQLEVTTTNTGSFSGDDSKPGSGVIKPSVEKDRDIQTQIIEPAKKDHPKPGKRNTILKILIPIGLLVIALVVAFLIANPYDSFWIREKGLLFQATRTSTTDNMEMVYVPAGSFLMGSVNQNADSDEGPVHEVYLDSFWIDKYEVSNAQYQVCVEAGGCNPPEKGELLNNPDLLNHPVVYVSWTKAKVYCEWAGRHLPSEAQWEKAARGNDQRIFPWGEGINCQYGQFDNCTNGTVAVNSFPTGQSAFGAFNMAGNVAEWVNDYYTEDYYTSRSSWINPVGPDYGIARVLRGGSWNNSSSELRTTNRLGLSTSYNNSSIGFRCVSRTEP